jgi:tetratricopeptide (TPR) repeat protein
LVLGATGWAFDIVRVANKPLVSGRVVGISHVEVVVEQGPSGGITKQIPVNEIISITYDQDPTGLKTARTHLAAGHFDEALASLEKLNPAQIGRPAIRQDVEFYKAYCRAQLALGGSGEIAPAGKEMIAFVNNHKDSYHWLKANEIVGDLLVANGSFAAAETYYAKVGEVPWPDYKMRAGVAIGRALLAQKKYPEALKSFEGVLAINADDDLAQAQRTAATLGKARVLAAENKPEEAVKLAEGALAKIRLEQTALMAQAYNVLGTAQRAAGRPKDALFAFLRVDLLYAAVPEAHAEALFNLSQLWGDLQRPDRAAQARQTLQQQYKSSPWAKQLR